MAITKKIFRTVQFLSHVATIVIMVLLLFVIVKQYLFFSGPTTGNFSQKPSSPSLVGRFVPLENVNWKANKKTLVLYISTTCRYCTESTPFYQQLVKKNSGKDVKIIAVFPQPIEEANEYLEENSINISQVYSASLMSLGLRGTPTLLLVNEDGVVSEYWRGKLSPDKETEVLNKLSS